jgi:ABC-2 type transport system permease protein
MSTATIDPTGHPQPRATILNPKILAIELRRVLRNRRTMIFTLIFPVVMFLFIAAQIKGKDDSMAPAVANVGAYIMVSMALYGAVMATTSAGASVSIERASGWSRQLRLTPLRPTAYILTKMVAALVMGILATGVTYAVGALTGKAHMPMQAWIESGAVVVIGSLAFAALGLFMGYLLPSDNAMQFLGPILAVLSIFGGIFSAPIDPSSAFGKIAQLTPIYGFGQIAHWPLTLTATGAHSDFHWSWVVNLFVWGAIFVAGAAWRFRKDTARV